MTTYDTLISDDLLPGFTDGSLRMPDGFRIIGPADGPAPPRCKRLRVADDNAPAWTEGKLITPTMTAEYETNDRGVPTGNVSRVVVTDWTEVTA